jgi:hypothetical protein
VRHGPLPLMAGPLVVGNYDYAGGA